MTMYLISFPSAAMVRSDEDLWAVPDASNAILEECATAVPRVLS